MTKRILSAFMAFVLLTFFSLTSLASGDVLGGEGVNVNLLQEIEFSYFSAADTTGICYYTNDYFSESSYVYNQSLSTMSLSLAFSAFGSIDGGEEDYSNKSSNAKDLLQKLGVSEENIAVNDLFNLKPTTDSIGVVAGNMPITVADGEYTLVAIAVRGAGYGQEWASNFTLGVEDQHKGFKEGKEQVLHFLKGYFADQNISGAVKLWITGYSRGAAVANLVAGAIDDGFALDDDITFDLDDVYSYCFEAPAGALIEEVADEKYENIFNIINPNDIVPFVAPYEMGFTRYGTDMFIPTAETDPKNYESLKASMLEFYYALEGTTTYTVDDFQMKKLGLANWLPGGAPIEFVVDDTKNDYSQNVFLSNYVEILAKEFFIDRDTYVSKYQDQIREVCSVVFGCTSAQQKILIDSFIAQAQKNWGALAWSYVWNAGINPWGDEVDALQMISDWLKIAIQDAGITDYDEEVVNSAGIALGDLMLALVTSHPNYFSTAVMNVDRLAEAHFPELCMAWMRSMDKNYTDETVEHTLNRKSYRIVYIDGNADVNVYKDGETLVASFVNEEVLALDNNYSFGFDGETKYIILPVDYNYTVALTSVDDSQINYTVKEYNSSVGFTRLVEFADVSVTSENTFNGVVPALSNDEIISGTPEGSTAEYTLVGTVSGDEAKDKDVARYSTFTVEAFSSNDEYGKVEGAKTYKYGEKATLNAECNEGCIFEGWYENDTLVSTDSVYTFDVYSNRSFSAKFTPIVLTPKDDTNVTVSNNLVYGISEKMTADAVKELFVGAEISISNSSEYVGTGSTIVYNGETYTVVVVGDIDGNGEVTSTDYVRLKSAFLENYQLDGAFKEASDVEKDGVLTITDYTRIKSYLFNKYDLYNAVA